MESKRLVSEFKNNLIAKRSKIVYATLIDYFLVLILTFLLFVCAIAPINSCLPSTKGFVNNMYKSRENLNQIVGETKIQDYDKENKSLVNISTTCKNYIKALVKTSYFVYDMEYPVFNSTPVKIDKEDTLFNIDNDNLTYFFINFKSSQSDLNDYKFEGIDYKDNKEEYLYLKMLGYSSSMISSYFISIDDYNSSSYKSSLSRYQILNKNTSINLMNYIERDDSNVTSIYNQFSSCYYQASSYGVDQIEKNYTKYINEYNSNFIPNYQGYLSSLLVCNIISYVLGFVVFEVLVYLLSKKKETIGNRVIKVAVISKDELELSWIQKLGLILSRFIFYFSGTFLCMIFANNLGATMYTFNGVSYLQFVIFSLGLGVISLLYLAFNKSHLLISNLITSTVFKSKEDFAPIKMLDKEEENGKSN